MDLSWLVTSITSYFHNYLYITLFVLIFIEEAGIPLPLPGDTWIFLSGFEVVTHSANPILIVLDVTIASVLGSSLLFFVSKKLGEPLVRKYGKYILLNEKRIDKGKSKFEKYGSKIILFGRWVPGFRIVLSVVAGVLGIQFRRFIISITLSSILWASFFVIIGSAFSSEYQNIIRILGDYIFSNYSIYIIVTISIIGGFVYYKKRCEK